MKYSFSLLLFWLVAFGSFSQSASFTLKGQINRDSKAKKIYLQGNSINIEIPITIGGTFFYKGALSQPEECILKTDRSKNTRLWITSGEIDVTLHEGEIDKSDASGRKELKITALSGPAETEKLQWLKVQQIEFSRQIKNVTFAQYKDSMAKYFDPLIEEYILHHPHSKFSGHIIISLAHSKENMRKFLSLIDKDIFEEERLKIDISIKRDSATQVGTTIEEFKMKTINGKQFSLKDLSSTYILLDFWAHDCGPCRIQHPELIKIYNEFHQSGFQIVGVALDESKAKWRKAIAKDKIPWIHISDLKGWDNFLAKRYFVEAIPFNILMDKNKKIIATGLSPKALQQKLKELLNN
jgi:thiol-disulfide isomerase/thioredoxin